MLNMWKLQSIFMQVKHFFFNFSVAVCEIVENNDMKSVYVTIDVTKFEESSNFRRMPILVSFFFFFSIVIQHL